MSAADAIGGEVDADHIFANLTEVTRSAEGAFEDAVAPLFPLLLRYFARRVTPAEDGIARKVLSNYRRGKVRRELAHEALRAAAAVSASPVPDEAFIAAEALKLLSERDQELIRLVVWEELSVAEAGRVVGIGPATARSRYARALTRLRGAYDTLDV